MDLFYKGAGTIPYYVSENGDIWVYLGLRANSPERGKWSLFGGGMERWDKNYVDTARRELYEELGFKVSNTYLREIWSINLPTFSFKTYALKCKRMIESPAGGESIENRWFKVDSIPSNISRFLEEEIKALCSIIKSTCQK